MQDRRESARVKTTAIVEYPSPESDKVERSFTRDLSETGLCFPTTAKLQVGQELRLTLELPGNPSTFQATGEVVWIREIARFVVPQYEVGVRFQWIEDPDRERLIRHLESLLRPRL